MITLAALARLAEEHSEAIAAPVEPIRIGDRSWIDEPVIMATVNLSRDSTYRESIATGPDSAPGQPAAEVAMVRCASEVISLMANDPGAAAAPLPVSVTAAVDAWLLVAVNARLPPS
jgi:dihydropteroate synthase